MGGELFLDHERFTKLVWSTPNSLFLIHLCSLDDNQLHVGEAVHDPAPWIQFFAVNRSLLHTVENNSYVQFEWKNPDQYRILGVYIVRKKADGSKYLLSIHHSFHGELFDIETLGFAHNVKPMHELFEVSFEDNTYESQTADGTKRTIAMVMKLGPIDALPYDVFTERQ